MINAKLNSMKIERAIVIKETNKIKTPVEIKDAYNWILSHIERQGITLIRGPRADNLIREAGGSQGLMFSESTRNRKKYTLRCIFLSDLHLIGFPLSTADKLYVATHEYYHYIQSERLGPERYMHRIKRDYKEIHAIAWAVNLLEKYISFGLPAFKYYIINHLQFYSARTLKLHKYSTRA